MKKPFIYIHTLMAMDGHIVGNFTKLPEETAAAPFFVQMGFGDGEPCPYEMDAWLNGTTTAITDYTYGAAPELDENAAPVPEGDYVAKPDAERYLVILDEFGELGWQKNYIEYGLVPPHVISVLGSTVSNAYKDFLRRKEVSYIECGKEDGGFDFAVMLDKLVELFGIKSLKVGGGGATNWTFLRQGFVDEVSLIVVPAADGNKNAPTVFRTEEGLTDDTPIAFEFVECKVDDKSGAIWLRYKVKKVWDRDDFGEEFGFGTKDFVAHNDTK